MASPKSLISAIESALLGPSPPTPQQKLVLLNAIHASLPSFKNMLSYPLPKPSDRERIHSKEVRLPDSRPITLDDMDVQIALRLSDDLNINEVDCVKLLVATNNKWGLLGRDRLEIFRLAAGLWYTERRDIITAFYLLLRAVVLDQGLEPVLVADIHKHLEELFSSGLRLHLLGLIKELDQEEPAGMMGSLAEPFVIDAKGALVERKDVVLRERMNLCQCVVLSVLVVRMGPKEVKDIFHYLKHCAANASDSAKPVAFQIAVTFLFSLVITFISDALGPEFDKASVLSKDNTFRVEFWELVIAPSNDAKVDQFMDVVRLAWVVHLMLMNRVNSPHDLEQIKSCLDALSSSSVFQFLHEKVLRSTAYQVDDEDVVYIYNAYLHKLMMCFLCQPLAFDMVKKMREEAANAVVLNQASNDDPDTTSLQSIQFDSKPFLSLLDLLGEIYQKEPELLCGNEDLWSFVNFVGEDHRNIQMLVAFLRMLCALASSEEGASRVFELLQGKTFRNGGWSTLYDSLSVYEQKFKQSFRSAGKVFLELPEGDARALAAYLNVLQKVMENGNPVERKKWFPDIEPLFKLLGYENVQPYLKGALRSAIAAFVRVSPHYRDIIWSCLEQYDLPVFVDSNVVNGSHVSGQVYDLRFELNEVEARLEHYPSTISFINLINELIGGEWNMGDRGHRSLDIFKFIHDDVFVPFSQRAYANPLEKWQLVVACLRYFKLILERYDIHNDYLGNVVAQFKKLTVPQSSISLQFPAVELLKNFMSGRSVLRNVMDILLVGVDAVIYQRTSQLHGFALEKSVELSFSILVLVFEKDAMSDFCRPLYQPMDSILSQDPCQIVALLEYVKYESVPSIQICSIKIMHILSFRLQGLVPLLLKHGAANYLMKDYAACLEMRSEESQLVTDSNYDTGFLILQLLIENVNRPAPNVAHLFLGFNVNAPLEQSILQPQYHYSCLKVILDILEKFEKPDVNALLHELGLQLLYELCMDPVTSGPTMDLLRSKKYQFFLMHLDTLGIAPLPKRNSNQSFRISSLHQRAWLLKLLALPVHIAETDVLFNDGISKDILDWLFIQDTRGSSNELDFSSKFSASGHCYSNDACNCKIFELLQVLKFKPPDTVSNWEQIGLKYGIKVDEILRDSSTSDKGGVYYYSERGDRLVDLGALREKFWKMFSVINSQLSSSRTENELDDLREAIHHLLRWGWRYNKNLEERAAQLHMLIGWSQIVEVAVSRGMHFLDNPFQILFRLIDISVTSSASVDCSLKMAVILTQVALTCMAKLRDERFLFMESGNSANITCLDVIMGKPLPNAAWSSILLKLIVSILRHDTSEALRRRQYALLLSYFQYCQTILNPDISISVVHYLLPPDQYADSIPDIQKIDSEQSKFGEVNFRLLKKEAQSILDVIIRDAIQGSHVGKAIAIHVLDAFLSIDYERYFLSQLQSRGFLRSCFTSMNNFFSQVDKLSSDNLQKLYTCGSELALMLRISHNYGKMGAQVLFSMGILDHLASYRIENMYSRGNVRRVDAAAIGRNSVELDWRQLVISPILRLVSCLAALVDTTEFLEVKNKQVRDIVDFIRSHQVLFGHILRRELSDCDVLCFEQINLVVSILSKVWPYEENDEYGLVQGLFGLMCALFPLDLLSMTSGRFQEDMGLTLFELCVNLSSYLYFLVARKSLRLQVSDDPNGYQVHGQLLQPTLMLLAHLLRSITNVLETAADDRAVLLGKILGINELSRLEIDEIISLYLHEAYMLPCDNIVRRRYVALMEMCKIVGRKDKLITLLLLFMEHLLNIFLIHFQDRDAFRGTMLPGTAPAKENTSFCLKLLSNLDLLEKLSEEKSGHDLKMLHRQIGSIKEAAPLIFLH